MDHNEDMVRTRRKALGRPGSASLASKCVRVRMGGPRVRAGAGGDAAKKRCSRGLECTNGTLFLFVFRTALR